MEASLPLPNSQTELVLGQREMKSISCPLLCDSDLVSMRRNLGIYLHFKHSFSGDSGLGGEISHPEQSSSQTGHTALFSDILCFV